MPVAAVRYASPASIPADLPRYAALSYPTGSVVPGDVKRLECGLYLPSESVPADRRKVGVVPYLPGATIPADMRRIIPVRSGSVAYANAVLADSPVAYWRLGESSGTNAADASGNANAGTYTGGVTLGQAGALAAEPDGTSNTAVLGDGTSGKITTTFAAFAAGSARTFEGWANPTDRLGRYCLFGSDGAGGKVILLVEKNGDVAFFSNTGSGQQTWNSAAPALGAWFHWALTYDDTSKAAELYINNVSKGTKTLAASYSGTVGNFMVAAWGGVAADPQPTWFKGYYDEIAVYATALSAARVQAHYAAGTGR